MSKPDSSDKPAAVVGGRPAPENIPDDVRAELDAEVKPTTGPNAPAVRPEPVPEDVLAEMDADARAEAMARGDPDAQPVALDEDSER